MQPTKAITIVLVVLILTGMCGFLLQPSHEEVSVTTYDYKGDLTPSVLYSQIDDWTEYNPLSNVTGWRPLKSDSLLIPENKDSHGNPVANQYILEPSVVNYTPGTAQNSPSNYLVPFPTGGQQNWTAIPGKPMNIIIHLGNLDYGLTAQGFNANYPIDETTKTNAALAYKSDASLAAGHFAHGGVTANYSTSGSTPGNTVLSTNTIKFILNTYTPTGDLWTSTQSTTGQGVYVTPLSWYKMDGIKNNSIIQIPNNLQPYILTEKIATTYGAITTYPQEYGPDTISTTTSTTVTMDIHATSVRNWIYDYNPALVQSVPTLYPAVQDEITGIWLKVEGAEGYVMDRIVFNGDRSGATDNITFGVPQYSEASYIDSTKFVQVVSGTATWSNSQVNGIVNVLCSPNTVFVIGENASISFPDDFPYDYGLVTLDFINKSYTCKGVSSLSNTLAYSTVDYTYNMKVEAVTFSSYDSRSAFVYEDGMMTVSKAIGGGASQFEPYAAIGSMTYDYYTVDMWPFYFVNHSDTSYKVYFPKPIEISEGVTTHVLEITPGVTETMQFGTWDGDTEYKVGVEWKDGEGATQYAIFRVHVVPNSAISQYPAYKDNSSDFTPVNALHIKTGNSSPAKVFIDSTVVAVDPSGLLWGDPSIPLNYFYPEQMTFDTRVLFNGFVKYGNSITINGQTFPVNDGRLVYTHTETVVPDEYPKISIRVVAPAYVLPAGHELMEITYLGGYYDYPVIVETEVAFSGGVSNTTVTLPNGEFQLGIVKSSGKYTLVGHDGNGYEYNGEIPTGQTGTTMYRLPGEVTITDYLPLKGMAVDFYRDPVSNIVSVSLVFTELNNQRIDLGVLDTTPKTLTYTVTVYDQESGTTIEQTKTIDTVAGYVISSEGNWFWQSGIYTINTALVDEVGLDWTSGQFGLTMAGCCFLMIFFMIIGTAVLYRFTEMEFTFLDWLVLGGVVILLLALAIM